MSIELSALTACGEDCAGCEKRLAGTCPGCIEADGYVPEWAGSGRCRVHACARAHQAAFCGVCPEFPCAGIREMMPWKADCVERMRILAQQYTEGRA